MRRKLPLLQSDDPFEKIFRDRENDLAEDHAKALADQARLAKELAESRERMAKTRQKNADAVAENYRRGL